MNYQTLSDEELLRKSARNDRQAFGVLYSRHARRLFDFACRKVPAEVAEEIVQDIFVRLWQNLQLTDEINNLSAYLLAAVRYAWLNYFRDQIVKEKFIAQNLQKVQIGYAERETIINDLQQAVDQAMAALPEKTRTVFHLSRFEGLPHKEIAHRLSLSEKAVEYHISQALKRLREYLQPFLINALLLFIQTNYCSSI